MSTIIQSLLGDQPLFLWVIIGLIGFGVTWKGANVVEESTSKISDRLGLSQAIQGGIVAAIATSFPELAIVVISVVFLGSFGLGAGALIGTAIFNLLVIPSLVTIITGDTHTNKGIVYRDSVFYMVSVIAFFAVLSFGVISTDGIQETTISVPMSVGMILIYFVYLALLFNKKKDVGQISKNKSISIFRQVGILLISLFVVLVGVESMVAMTVEVSEALNAPPFLISVTVLSILSSFPDLLVGIRMGEDDERKAAVSNVFGTNTFNILIVLPIGAIIAGGVTFGFVTAVPLVIFLFSSTLVVIVLAATDFEITQIEAYSLLVLYILFLLWMTLESLGYTYVLTEETIEAFT